MQVGLTNLFGLFCGQVSSCESKLSNQTVIADYLGQSLKCAQVGSHANAHLANTKVGVTGSVANVSCSNQIDTRPYATTVYCTDDRLLTFGNTSEGVLQKDNHLADKLGPSRNVISMCLVTAHHTGHHLHHIDIVNASTKHTARTGNDHCPTLLIIGNLLKAGVNFPEHVSIECILLLRPVQLNVQNVVVWGGHLDMVVVSVTCRVSSSGIVSSELLHSLHFAGGERSTGGSGHLT